MNKKVRRKLDAAINQVLTETPLYGKVFMYLNKRPNNQIQTMGVGVIRKVDLALYYNEDFVEKLSRTELWAVLKHEALHVLLHHLTRQKFFNYNMKGYNIAADMAINTHIKGLPEGALYPSTFGLEDGKSSEYYYEKLKKEAEKSDKGDGFFDDYDTTDDHSMWEDFDQDIISEKVRTIAKEAMKAQDSQGWGDLNGSLIQEILSANKPKVNWKKQVRYFINQLVVVGRKSTRSRDNRRTADLYPYLYAGSKRRYSSRLLVAFDTSGSVSDKKLKEFHAELNGMVGLVQTDVICFDTVCHGSPQEYNKKRNKLVIKGRGGTDFDPVIRLVDELKYDGLIIFTDGYAPIPKKPRSRVMWCLTSEDDVHQFPYGKKVIITD
jgi:predicted metal-dependent peptidase